LNLHRIIPVAGLSLLCGLVLCGCGTNYTPSLSKSSREAKLREMKKFDAFRIYYAGEKAAGLTLTGISGEEWQRNGSQHSPGPEFGYGSCKLPNGLFAEGGCHLPLSIQNWSRCSRWPGQYPHGHRPRVFDFRGAKAAWHGDGLEIYAGHTTTVIFGTNERVIKAAARQLRDVRQADPPTLLPRTAPGSLWGKLPCQRERRLDHLKPELRTASRGSSDLDSMGREGLEPSTDGL